LEYGPRGGTAAHHILIAQGADLVAVLAAQ
jgi:hypothetical protein